MKCIKLTVKYFFLANTLLLGGDPKFVSIHFFLAEVFYLGEKVILD